MEFLYELYASKLASTPTDFVRYLYNKIDWNSQLIAIVGTRGVGKTTLLFQRIKLSGAKDTSLYISADNTYFTANSMFDTAAAFCKNGGKVLYIDEVHKYPNWSKEVKMMYDYLPDLKLVVTGSSILDIISGTDADLSRRAITYELHGLSFREYLNYSLKLDIQPFVLDDILMGKADITDKVPHPIAHFKQYLQCGYFPFYGQDNYQLRLENVINHTLEIDIPTFANMNISTARKLKKLLYIISQSVPFKPKYTEIGRAISADRGSVADYMVFMEKAGLINRLMLADGGMAMMEKVEKVYLANTNLIYALSGDSAEIGNVRETFFLSATSVNQKVLASQVSDFKIGDCTFEVGGKSKGKRQIRNVENAFVVKDDIEHAYMNTIPLWAFGLNY